MTFVEILAAVALLQDPAAEREAPPRTAQDVLFLEKARVKNDDGTITVVYQVGAKHGVGEHPEKDKPRSLAKEIRPLIEKFKSDKGWIFENDTLGLLVVTDAEANVKKIDEILRAALTPEPQVKIEVQVIEVRWTKRFEVGFFGTEGAAGDFSIWLKSTPTGAFLRELRTNFTPTAAAGTSPFIGSSFRFFRSTSSTGTIGGILQTFVERGRAEIKSNPVVWVKSGSTATIKSGEEVPFPESQIHPGGVNTTVRYKETGVELVVTPHVISKDTVSLDLNPKITAVLGREVIASSASGTTLAPSFTRRELRTSVIARNGEAIVIGGLTRKERVHTRRGIPLLMDIPILGYLFSKTEDQELNTEIIFMLKPTVFATLEEAPRGVFDPVRKK